MQNLNQNQIQENLSKLENWQCKETEFKFLEKSFNFSAYLQGIEFVQKIAIKAETANHHPVLIIDYCKIIVQLVTHSAKGLTDQDFALAAQIDQIFENL